MYPNLDVSIKTQWTASNQNAYLQTEGRDKQSLRRFTRQFKTQPAQWIVCSEGDLSADYPTPRNAKSLPVHIRAFPQNREALPEIGNITRTASRTA